MAALMVLGLPILPSRTFFATVLPPIPLIFDFSVRNAHTSLSKCYFATVVGKVVFIFVTALLASIDFSFFYSRPNHTFPPRSSLTPTRHVSTAPATSPQLAMIASGECRDHPQPDVSFLTLETEL